MFEIFKFFILPFFVSAPALVVWLCILLFVYYYCFFCQYIYSLPVHMGS